MHGDSHRDPEWHDGQGETWWLLCGGALPLLNPLASTPPFYAKGKEVLPSLDHGEGYGTVCALGPQGLVGFHRGISIEEVSSPVGPLPCHFTSTNLKWDC